ncbi:hypothetical protein H2248_000370 [Termitomyces sp. 'cryptogamus']|nr:hypothetical protein H2248_000370 [Termitomyces sp. 'cryptogamus']
MLSFMILLISVLAKKCFAAPVCPGPSRGAGAEPFVLPSPTDGPGPTFDATATRASTSAQIRSLASPNTCFDVSDFRAGDFRFNLVPIAMKQCDPSVDGQKFDLITKVEEFIVNTTIDLQEQGVVTSTIILVLVFSLVVRAAGDGGTTADQQYFFNSTANFSSGIGFPLVRNAVNNGIGPGNQCLALNSDGFLSNTPCTPPFFTPEQTWVIGDNGFITPPTAASDTPVSNVTTSISVMSNSLSVMSSPSISPSQVTVSSVQCQSSITSTQFPPSSSAIKAATTITTTNSNASKTNTLAPTSTSSSVPEKFVLPVPVDGPGPTFDATATRAATSVQIRSATSPDTCLDVSDFRAGDFRFNLVPIALKKCDSSIDGQKFDLITKGVHNDVPDGSRTLIVSSQQFTCIDRLKNKNDHLRPGLFACGGRAAGDGGTQSDEQFFFNSTAKFSDGIGFPYVTNAANGGVGPGNQCLSFNTDGFASNIPCAPPFFTPEQIWIVG